MSLILDPADCQYPGVLRVGDAGPKVKLLQEWLGLAGHSCLIDGDFGPATKRALSEYQTDPPFAKAPSALGELDEFTWDGLVAPMRRAVAKLPTPATKGKPLAQLLVMEAQKHLREHPREVGGQNRGPWVRLYMRGLDGPAWPWCCGMATFLLERACDRYDQPHVFPWTPGCDSLADLAHQKGLLRLAPHPSRVKPGWLFLVRKNRPEWKYGWQHVGIVRTVDADTLSTVEGNTNDNGDAEGYEACSRIRAFRNLDFIEI